VINGDSGLPFISFISSLDLSYFWNLFIEIKYTNPINDSNAKIKVIAFEDGIPAIKIDVGPSEPPIIPIELALFKLMLNL